LILLALLAFCLRLAAVFVLGSYREPFAYEHGEIAESLIAGQGFSVTFLGTHGPTSQQAPLYPGLLAAAYWLFGVKSPAAFLAIQLLQCAAGAATAVCTAWLAWSVTRVQGSGFRVQDSDATRRSPPPASCPLAPVPWLAGLIAACHPAHVYAATHVQVAPWATLLLTLLVAVAVSPTWRGRWSGAILVGLIGGVGLLVEPILVLAMPVVAMAFWYGLNRKISRLQPAPCLPPVSTGGTGGAKYGCQPASAGLLVTSSDRDAAGRAEAWRRSPAKAGSLEGSSGSLLPPAKAGGRRGVGLSRLNKLWHIALMAAVTLTLIAPWLWRNHRIHGEFVFVKSTFGYALWQGNNPASWGTDKVPKPSAEALRRAHDGSLMAVHRAAWEARHETLYIDDVLLKPTGYREFAGLSEPQRCRLLGGRAWEFITQQPGEYVRLCGSRLRYFLLWDETNPKAANVVYRATSIAWLVLCLAGLWLTRRHWRRLWPTYAVFGVIMLFHVLTILSARFRIPLEPLSFVWAAAACLALSRAFAALFSATRIHYKGTAIAQRP
jgi:hypothetical protein